MSLRNRLVSGLKQVARAIGGELLSNRAVEELRSTRARAIAELTAHEQQGLTEGLTVVIFSKDRPLQIYSLLESYFNSGKNLAPMVVIYNASSEAYARAYDEVAAAFKKQKPTVKLVREVGKFCQILPDVLSKVNTRNIMFMVDDMVIIRPLDLKLAAKVDPLKEILSLRLSPHLRRSYTCNVDQLPPVFRQAPEGKDVLEFDWFTQGNEWSYPWSVDGHVFSTAEIRVLSRIANYKAPNSYEGALMEFVDLCRGRRGLCYQESKVLNLPINKVQSENENLAGNVSPQFLLEQWNKGLMLDVSGLRKHVPLAPHEEHTVVFKKR